ncbi:rhomboid family intramembrane serine protease [Pseudactinotalea sp. HY158]|uniref:rhomboid family intramembrane serine protease n=1 Tax=Pseudactinotalea sp. HY158 TaxID=2654547 RepID=UPI00129CFC83|nr:rhomboid family intramembrane serine protease [Pseudactinotalea sp. HY158]QGH69651.1 rhomboid family intramembrane serine protease [Pseudactinotalea sp. HY158]
MTIAHEGSMRRAEPTRCRRRPWLTGAVFAVTAAMGVAQLIHPALLDALERSPAALHGQWWRFGTALLVQDGGIAGLASNLLFLALIGAIAEQVISRGWWIVQYLAVGVATEFLALLWQPIGGGNSIAVCGLTGAVAVAAWHRHERLPRWAPSAVALWCGALLATAWLPLIVLGFVGAGVARIRQQAGRSTGELVLAAVIATGAALAVVADIHGAALMLGLLLAWGRRR